MHKIESKKQSATCIIHDCVVYIVSVVHTQVFMYGTDKFSLKMLH